MLCRKVLILSPYPYFRSILGPLLFNIDLIDLFFECEESNIASYGDVTTPYSYARDIQALLSELQFLSSRLFH